MSTKLGQNIKLVVFDWEGTLCSHGELFPESKSTLMSLKQNNIMMALATSMSTAGVKALLRRYELEDFFQHIQTSEMGYPKPDPQMLREVLTACDIDAKQSIMVGDSIFDMTMATQANIASIAVLTGADNEQRFIENNPSTVIINAINDLPKLLGLG